MYVCMRVYVCVSSLKAIITSGVICTPYGWLNKVYSFYVAAVVITSSGHDLRIEAHHRNHHKKCKIALHKPLLSL